MKKILALTVVLILLLAGCSEKPHYETSGIKSEENKITYAHISQEEAIKMMETEKDFIILDVRTEAEFSEGHIKGAINIENENIIDKEPKELPDKEQKIFVYCRSGNRSQVASQKLAEMGYTNVYEMGGINTWQGEIVK